jgi:thymidylate synthase (FAD)
MMELDSTEVLAYEMQVLDRGFVRLDAAEATDLSVVNAARVSFAVRHEEMEAGDDGLIRFLMRERHGTPFEHNMFRFHVKAPLFVVREWQRHRMASYNELSGRYKKFENPEFYIPRPEHVRTQTGKPGEYTFERWQGNTKQFIAQLERHNQDAVDLYNYYVDNGVAKELARIVLPVSLYTEFYYTVNARSLMNFLSLRNAPAAMYEIAEYAVALEGFFGMHMPITAEAFRANGRQAP